jgi:apolipoprotein N-acyltransferase
MNSIQLFFKSITQHYCFWALLSGSLLPFGFAPFHCPGIAILGIALFFAQLTPGLVNTGINARKRAFLTGFSFGVGYFSVGVSWVFVSIHDYGHLNFLMAGIITLIFILYLAFYLGLLGYLFQITAKNRSKLVCCLLFSGLWCLCEYLRATLLTGFPWLLLGFGQLDTPLKYLLPIIGFYGVGFLTALAASLLVLAFQKTTIKSIPGLIAFVGLLILPLALKNKPWTTELNKPISVGIIQANLSMKDKWDEALFWKLLSYYENKTNKLLGKNDLIVMPESAIPAPDNYVTDFLDKMHQKGLASNTSILLGIPSQPSEAIYYNSLLALGKANGSYQKKQLVPFGEFIPKPLQKISNWLSIPIINMTAGEHVQPLVLVDGHPIATLICYELAYPMLLREQLPEAEWIVSISDDGWFGKSFAIYQQLQMAQALSIQTGRYQVVANNDGLSAVIDASGNITDSLPAYQAGILNSKLYAHQGSTPWVTYGDAPVLFFSLFIFLMSLIQRGYSMRALRMNVSM